MHCKIHAFSIEGRQLEGSNIKCEDVGVTVFSPVSAHPPFFDDPMVHVYNYVLYIQMACLCKCPPPLFGTSISSARGRLLERVRYYPIHELYLRRNVAHNFV